MLPRVLEPEVMDTFEDARDYDAMDHNEVNARFVADFLAFHGSPESGDWLDVGTGTALIPIALCQAVGRCRIIGADLSEQMLQFGHRNVVSAGYEQRIRLDRVDAKMLPYPDGRFEAVLSNSIVHHIPEPYGVIVEMLRLVAPGGSLFVRDLVRPQSREELDRLVRTYTASEPDHARNLFRASLNAALTVEEVRSILQRLELPEDGVQMTSDRHWTWSWRRPAR